MAPPRDELHRLVEHLPDRVVGAAKRILEALSQAPSDSVTEALAKAAMKEPESLSDEDREALREAYDDLMAGRVVSHEEIKREFNW